ncbi:BgtTE-56028 [Blumeria graminis f. sp. tritici]|uniref:BgtTE-56028 n=1 Tax=Blumeria graminis f. sp. tritici TaxID=62690 RepID=A0A9X9LAU8_BLUGR|nr:BgtTE-56028 [Blumeria graminis f. sp. tritici]
MGTLRHIIAASTTLTLHLTASAGGKNQLVTLSSVKKHWQHGG